LPGPVPSCSRRSSAFSERISQLAPVLVGEGRDGGGRIVKHPIKSGSRRPGIILHAAAPRSQAINFTEFGPKIGEVRLHAQASDQSSDHFMGPIFATVTVEILFKPVMQRAAASQIERPAVLLTCRGCTSFRSLHPLAKAVENGGPLLACDTLKLQHDPRAVERS
jgi:hypothetical protein